MGVVGRQMNPPSLAFRAREGNGGGWQTNEPSLESLSRISSEGGEWGWVVEKRPLHLTFQVREGNGGGWQTNEPSPMPISLVMDTGM